MKLRWWQKLSLVPRARKCEWALFAASFSALILLVSMHLLVDLGFISLSLQNARLACVVTAGMSGLAFAVLSFITASRFHRMRARLAVSDWESTPSTISHVVPARTGAVRVLLSTPVLKMEQRLVSLLTESFIDESGNSVEIVTKPLEKDALCAVTDNVFDLVVLAGQETSAWSFARLSESIKKLDRNIPVVHFADESEDASRTYHSIDAQYKLPNTSYDLRRLSRFVKRSA